MAIADRMALYVDPVFHDPRAYHSGAIWMAVIAYAIQIYCDFSGYTDLALGTAHLLGYKLTVNFKLPYLAANVAEFWHRWHISLSTWLRDYLFIPLGGSRGSRWQTVCNLLITMTLGGLWHGAAWTFVSWGLLHGLLLAGHRSFREWCKTRPRLDGLLQSPPGTVVRVSVTFLSVCVGWVFFRAPTFGVARDILRRLVIPHGGHAAPLPHHGFMYLVSLVVLCHLLGHFGVWKRLTMRLPAPVAGLAYATAITVALVLAPEAGKAFIYFQF